MIQRNQSRFHLDLLTTTKIPSDLISLQSKTKEWFILISSVEHTKYFHVNVQTGQLSLIRSLDELINQTNSIELHVNVTQNWIEFRTIKVDDCFSVLREFYFYIPRFLFVFDRVKLNFHIFLNRFTTHRFPKLFQLASKLLD